MQSLLPMKRPKLQYVAFLKRYETKVLIQNEKQRDENCGLNQVIRFFIGTACGLRC